MRSLVWSTRFSVGIDKLDEQHATLFNLGRQLRRELIAPAPLERKLALFDILLDHTRMHFAVEESLLRFFRYENHADHGAANAAFMAEAVRLRGRLAAGDPYAAWASATCLKEGIVSHVANSDVGFAQLIARWAEH